jgi:glycosyltransferase involved in cell wall biosynthesis
MRFHILGIQHTKTTKEFSPCPFTQHTRLLCKMLTEAGHTVYHYGGEGSNPICTENINVLDDDIYDALYGSNYLYGKDYWKKTFFLYEKDNHQIREFNKNAINEIKKRKQKNDFLLCTYGNRHKIIADAVGDNMIVVEPGIGYTEVFAPYKIFTTYNWMHYIFGLKTNDSDCDLITSCFPSLTDSIISPPFDVNDYIYNENKEDYYFFIGRLVEPKGIKIAVETVRRIGGKLIVAGQGDFYYNEDFIEYVGVVNIEERAKLMSNAKATFAPTLCNEAFGMVVIESLFSGTPVITTDFGSFPEIVPHGKVGYRCRTFDEFVWAANNIHTINSRDCRDYAEANFSCERVLEKLERYFTMILNYHNHKNWYSENEVINNIDWLKQK